MSVDEIGQKIINELVDTEVSALRHPQRDAAWLQS